MDKKDKAISKLVEFIYQIEDMIKEEGLRSGAKSPFATAFPVEELRTKVEKMIRAIELLGLEPTVEEKEEAREEEKEEE